MFIAALFFIAQLEAAKMSCNRWMNKLQLIHTVEYYSLVKRNEALSCKIRQRNWDAYCQKKEASLERLHTVWFPTVPHSGKSNTCGDQKWQWLLVLGGVGEGWVGGAHGSFRTFNDPILRGTVRASVWPVWCQNPEAAIRGCSLK